VLLILWGVKGTDYTWPNTTAITLLNYPGNLNTFRVPFLMERLAPNGLAEPFDDEYLASLVRVSNPLSLKFEKHRLLD
jgi:endoglucanase